MNEVQLIGRLAKDPEPCCPTNQTPGEKSTKITLIVKGSQHKTFSKYPVTPNHIVVSFYSGPSSVVQRYLRKGDKILIKGKLRSRCRANGKIDVEVVGKKVIFLHLLGHAQ